MNVIAWYAVDHTHALQLSRSKREQYHALSANLASVLLLLRYKDGDANVRSVWLCSRNDAISNVAVMGAALAVSRTESAWPDLLVAGIMAGMFLTSSMQILRQAWAERREAVAA